MKANTAYNLFIELTCAILIFVFLYTALSKLNHQSLFAFTLSKSPLLRDSAGWLSWAIPATEIILAVLLVFPRTKIHALRWSFILLSAFTLYIGYMLLFSPSLPCSCGGVIQQMSWTQHLLFNISLLVLTLLSILFINKKTNPGMKLQEMPKT